MIYFRLAVMVTFFLLAVAASASANIPETTDYEQTCRQYAEEEQVAEEEISAYIENCLESIASSEDENQSIDTIIEDEVIEDEVIEDEVIEDEVIEDDAIITLSEDEEACLQKADEAQITDDDLSDYMDLCVEEMLSIEGESEVIDTTSEDATSEDATSEDATSEDATSEDATSEEVTD